jgi:hypothetical protein
MPPIIEGPPEEGEARRPLGRRLLWFVALWVGSLIAVAGVAYALRALIMR